MDGKENRTLLYLEMRWGYSFDLFTFDKILGQSHGNTAFKNKCYNNTAFTALRLETEVATFRC